MKKVGFCIFLSLLMLSLGVGIYFLSLEEVSSFELKDGQESDISFETNKINLYLFYGKGCPHCEEMIVYLNSLPNSLKRKINLNTFEVWDNEESFTLFMDMGEKLDIKMKSVPFLFVGDTYFEGFRENDKKEIKNAIKNYLKSKDKKDLYQKYLDLKTE